MQRRGRDAHLAVACAEEEGLGGGGVGEADHHAERGRVPLPRLALAAASSARRVEADPAARLQAHGDLERRGCVMPGGAGCGQGPGAYVYDAVDEVLESVA